MQLWRKYCKQIVDIPKFWTLHFSRAQAGQRWAWKLLRENFHRFFEQSDLGGSAYADIWVLVAEGPAVDSTHLSSL